MNVKLRNRRDFLAATWLPDDHNNLMLNHYELNMTFITRANNQQEINTAINRVYYFIDQELSHTIFVQDHYPDVVRMLRFMNVNVTTVPHEPVDQIIGMMLFVKFRSIMEARVDIDSLEISSQQGGHVIYVHEHDDSLGPFDSPGWWHTTDTLHCDDVQPCDDQTTSLDIQPDQWRDLDLHWQPTCDRSTVLHVDFLKK